MNITRYEYNNVLPNGTFTDRLGAVEVERGVTEFQESGRYYVRVCKGLKNGTVSGFSVAFDSVAERTEFLINSIEAAL